MTRMTAKQYRELGAAKPTKYKSEAVVIDGVRFASKREGHRYCRLLQLVQSGEYRDLRLHPKYPLMVGGTKIADYVADFAYVDCRTGQEITEDVKSKPTAKNPVYRLKKKFFEAQYGRKIRETF